jgi:hypothetical protein
LRALTYGHALRAQGGAAPGAACCACACAEFTWNAWLAAPFAAAGVPSAVPPLVQGLAECRVLADAAGTRFAVALLARRSRLHPGTRYLARGLNDVAAPGNEVECEQLCWRVPDASQAPEAAEARWASHVWRRGTVPIRWGAEIKNTVGEAEIYVAAREPYDGTGAYFARLAALYAPPPAVEAEAEAAKRVDDDAAAVPADADSAHAQVVPAPVESACADAPPVPPPRAPVPPACFPITCVNLLRSGLRAPELLLTEHFHEGARSARRRHPGALSQLRVLNFDWHANVKALGEAAAVEGLWAQLEGACGAAGVTTGVTRTHSGAAPPPSAPLPPPAHAVAAWQRGIVRYNCADSLDRTNLASFFGAVQVLMEQAKQLGLAIEVPPAHTGGGAQDAAAAGAAAALAGAPGRRFSPGAQSLWAQPAGGAGAAAVAAAAAAAAAALSPRAEAPPAAPPPPLPPGWESRRDAVRCPSPEFACSAPFSFSHAALLTCTPLWRVLCACLSLCVIQVTGNVFYIDHNTRSTTWTRPAPPPAPPAPSLPLPPAASAAAATPGGGAESPPPSPGRASSSSAAAAAAAAEAAAASSASAAAATFGAFGRSVDSLRATLLPPAAAALAELFLLNGDLHAALYTGSRALNSGMIHLLDGRPGGGRSRGASPAASAASSIGISVQRRFINLTLDASRQLAFEAFLGLGEGCAGGEEGEGGGAEGGGAGKGAPPRSERLYAHR